MKCLAFCVVITCAACAHTPEPEPIEARKPVGAALTLMELPPESRGPIETLTRVWSVPVMTGAQVSRDGEQLIFSGAHSLIAVGVDTAETSTLPVTASAIRRREGVIVAQPYAEPRIVGMQTDGTDLWELSCEPLGTLGCAMTSASAAGVIYFVRAPRYAGPEVSRFVMAVDATTGVERWKTSLPVAAGGHPVIVNDRLIVVQEGWVTAFGAGGDAAWTREVAGRTPVASAGNGDVIGFPDDAGLELVDGATGVTRVRIAGEGRPDWSITGKRVIRFDRESKTLAVFDLATGAHLWTWSSDNGTLPFQAAADESFIYTIDLDRTIRAHDGKSGAVRWIGGYGGRAIHTHGGTLFVIGDRTVSALQPNGGAANTEIVIRGRVQADKKSFVPGFRVRLGDRIVETDSDGQFLATVVARGELMVAVVEPKDNLREVVRMHDRCAVAPAVVVDIDDVPDELVIEVQQVRCPH